MSRLQPAAQAIIEGLHLSRGAIAAACCARAAPNMVRLGLALGSPLYSDQCDRVISVATRRAYLRTFRGLLKRTDNALVIPCSQRGTLIANRFRKRHMVLAEPYLTSLASFDKFRLRARQELLTPFLLPWSPPSNPSNYPAILKPRLGHSSIGQRVIRSPTDLPHSPTTEQYYVEPYLTKPFEEFSLTVVRTSRAISWMCIRRIRQQHGRTIEAARIESEVIQRTAIELVAHLTFDTLYNIQFARKNDETFVLDLNPRFGHSELYRTCFGFNFVAEILGVPSAKMTPRVTLTERHATSALLASDQRVCE